MTKYIIPNAFVASARKSFDFLVEEKGFVGPDTKDYSLRYSSNSFDIVVLYDDRDGRVFTLIEGAVDDRNPSAGIQCLYVEVGLGPPQNIRDIARSTRTLATALASQSSALRELLPKLEEEHGIDFLLKCHGC